MIDDPQSATTEHEDAPPASPPSPGPGLAPGRPPSGDDAPPAPRDPDEIIADAATGNIAPADADLLTAHFLGSTPKPGTSKMDEVDVEVDLGRGSAKWACKIKPISWSQWEESQERGTNRETSRVDSLVIAAWNVAQALVTPQLGRLVSELQREAQASEDGKYLHKATGERRVPPEHTPALLIDFFSEQSGSLLELSHKVLAISKLSTQNDAVREVEAGKA